MVRGTLACLHGSGPVNVARAATATEGRRRPARAQGTGHAVLGLNAVGEAAGVPGTEHDTRRRRPGRAVQAEAEAEDEGAVPTTRRRRRDAARPTGRLPAFRTTLRSHRRDHATQGPRDPRVARPTMLRAAGTRARPARRTGADGSRRPLRRRSTEALADPRGRSGRLACRSPGARPAARAGCSRARGRPLARPALRS